ncbi:MAG TPA: hypothetical protein VMZ71_13895 [Gemmataceae bacterium]|nr:hypothetical protein [Gemmataceae bacterium]
MTTRVLPLLVLFVAGCGGGDANQPKFPDLHPVKGVVKNAGTPVKGGVVTFAADPPSQEFLVNSEVAADGTFTLSTVRTTDTRGERKTGAPAGKYTVAYLPPLGDQTAGPPGVPVDIPTPATVQTGENALTVELPKK